MHDPISIPPSTAAQRTHDEVTFADATRVWAKIGLLSFGGPAGQIALMHKELVEERKWIDEARFLHALNYCMLLPGPEAQQLATYIGWLMHRTRGGLTAGLLFVLPGYLALLALSVLYARYGTVPTVAAAFLGLKAAVFAVVLDAVRRIGQRALKRRWMITLAILAFVCLFLFAVPFPLVVLGAGALGLIGSVLVPHAFPAPTAGADEHGSATLIDRLAARGALEHTRPSRVYALRVLGVCTLAWVAPLALLALVFGARSVFVTEGLFFSQAAVVTFGGAYAVLAFIAQRAVDVYGWLRPGEMLDGLGLAETTPGPLIIVVEFVGFMGALRDPHGLPPLAAGLLGATITVWVTFVPCFLWIFLGAPYIEALRGHRGLHAALSSITAAVVGVIANLSVWFGMHVAFRTVTEHTHGPVHVKLPVLSSLDLPTCSIAALAVLALFRLRWPLPRTLLACACAGIAREFLR